MAPVFTCRDCGAQFTVDKKQLQKFPGWTPRQCLNCRFPKGVAQDAAASPAGPDSGVFTDGACDPNPGPGGWGAVKVLGGEILAERSGHDADTTNNRMELTALIQGYRMVDAGEAITVFSDSIYCVRTVNEWAEQWRANGWRRGKKKEPVQNLELVQELFELSRSLPLARAEWIRGHSGHRWNEYADALSRAYQQAPGAPADDVA
jgi:ribonuclease HI